MKIFVWTGLIILSILFDNKNIRAQDFQCKTYTTKEGLSNNFINDVLRDDKGFLWVATGNGLNRFDGNIFDVYLNNPTDTNSIGSNQLHSLFIDKKKQLWVSTSEGISLYNSTTNNFKNYAPDTSVLTVSGVSFGSLCEDEKGNFFTGCNNDLLIFNPQKNIFTNSGWGAYAASLPILKGNRLRVAILNIVPKCHNELWVLSTYGLFSVNTTSLKFQFYPYNKASDYHGAQLKYASKEGLVWISLYGDGIISYNDVTKEWKEFHTPRKYAGWDNAHSVQSYNGDTLMYLSINKLLFFNAKTGSIINTGNFAPFHIDTVDGMHSYYLIKDHPFLWIGTNKGLIQILPKQNIFVFNPMPSTKDVSRVWRSSINGNLLFADTELVCTEKGDKKIVPILDEKNKKIYSSFLNILETKNGLTYFNSNDKVYVLNTITNKAAPLPMPPKRNLLNFI
jgi:ligand-binding sensor domain-containing protein